MATLQTIRTKAGLLVAIVIGISLAAFILGDMFQGGSSLFQRNQLELGKINGESVQYPEFQRQVEELGEIYRMNTQTNQIDEETWAQIREETWQNIVRNLIMEDVYEDLGVSVSPEELFDMLQGTNLHPIIQQLFRNPNTGQVDRGAVLRFLKNLETGVSPEHRNYWLYLEKQIVDERIQSKYNTLVSKGLYVTSAEAENSLREKNKQIDFDYIQLSFNTVTDSQVTVTDNELRNYYNSNKENYKQEKIRRIEYITFPVTPSNDDYENAKEWIHDAVSDFASATDNVAFVNSNSDVGFDDTWYKKDELPEDIGEWIFETGAEINDLFGPYFEDDAYKLAKLHASEMMPDSVEARHILLQVNSQEEVEEKQALADSLKKAIEEGSDFATLAREFSDDQGSVIQGGSLGWFGRDQMVKPFEEAAFNNKINEVNLVTSQFGIHIIQTTRRGEESRQVQVAYLVRNVEPSTSTFQNVYARASEFAGKNTTKEEFDVSASEQNLNKQAASVREDDREIPGLGSARGLIRAAYDTKPGNMIEDSRGSTIFDLHDNFVIATLVSATEDGIANFESVKDRVELAVLKEKKAELLIEKANAALASQTGIEAVSAELGIDVKTASNINFNSVQIPGAGMEPAVIGTASSLEPGQTSQPVAGNNGVYIVQVTSVDQGTDQDIESEKFQLTQNLAMRVRSQAFTAHRGVAEIEDKRTKFY